MEIKDIKKELEKAIIAFATLSNNKPHNICVMYAKVVEGNIVITDNYMKKTISNIKKNPDVSLVFWDEKKGRGWRVNGKAEYHKKGKWMDYVKELKENKKEPAKGAVVIEVKEIREMA